MSSGNTSRHGISKYNFRNLPGCPPAQMICPITRAFSRCMPWDTLSTIISYLDRPSLLSASLACTDLRIEAEKNLYNDGLEITQPQIVPFCNAVLSSPRRAGLVRRLNIPSASVNNAEFIVATLRALPNLTSLTLCMPSANIIELGARPVPFHLKSLSIRPQRVYEWLGLFEQQSSSLEILSIEPISSLPPVHIPSPEACIALSLSSTTPASSLSLSKANLLPNLHTISAPLPYIHVLAPHRPITNASICTRLRREDLVPLISTMGLCTASSGLTDLSIARYRFRADRIAKIASTFPHLKMLRMVSLHPGKNLDSEFNLGEGLGQFRGLESVRFYTGNVVVTRSAETRKALVDAWGRDCPSLCRVGFGGGVVPEGEEVWVRRGVGTWRLAE